MKYFKIYIISFLTIFGISCSDFLEEKPRDEISIDQYFETPAHAENAVNSLYRNGAPQMYSSGGVYSGTRILLGQYMTGFFDNEYKGQEPHIQNAQQLTLNGINLDEYLSGIWGDLYLGISRANNAIKYIPETPGLDTEQSNKLMAEAKFYRAFGYYFLVRLFGDVPLIEEPYESLENLFVPRSSVNEVYDLITSDLEFAVNSGGLPEASMVNNGYRITQGTVASLLAEVYLTMGGYPLETNKYTEAAQMARKVINSNVYSLTQHDFDVEGELIPERSAYNKIRNEEALANEYVYLIEYFVGISTSVYPQWSYPVSFASDVKYAITNSAYQPVKEFLWGYNKDIDLRMQEKQYYHSSFEANDGSIVEFPMTPFIWHDDEALFETANSGKDLRAYSYADVLLIAAEAIAKSEGVTAEAVDYLTQVRKRAYWELDEATIKSELSGLSADEFIEEVWKERYRELVFDFKLWFDMVRTRKYPKTSETGNGEIDFVNFVGQANTWGKTFETKHLLLPLPERELQRNPSLKQNEGY
ncbi:RagB/SusD family nutrient uptake outer membrane protein [Flexithrix dorotheae]|uniref:RagB/SusD family nutrient uptake outer membrane protein n=1 Tax=Flexithrix dorotheae TaxID=70993 RepID=UPI00037CB3F1|nr:RagB/SusD family nutrient uptake outer membrane protein [Flexithrix dorotheae]